MILHGLALAFSLSASAAPVAKPWLFFDLGKTLIDHTPQYADMRFLPGAADYLAALSGDGYRLGLLVNWPEEEGQGDREKLELLKAFVAPRWVDSRPLDWSLFDAVLFPPKTPYEKPHPYLFEKALRLAAPCPALFQGELEEEVRAATLAGMTAHRVEYFPAPGKPTIPLLPLSEVDAWRRHHVINLFGCQQPAAAR